jgi:hypothetical protein
MLVNDYMISKKKIKNKKGKNRQLSIMTRIIELLVTLYHYCCRLCVPYVCTPTHALVRTNNLPSLLMVNESDHLLQKIITYLLSPFPLMLA